jgi:hypothetical protein
MTKWDRPIWANKLTPDDVTDITALHDVGNNRRERRFKWRGHSLVLRFDFFRAYVDTANGQPVCCRYGAGALQLYYKFTLPLNPVPAEVVDRAI